MKTGVDWSVIRIQYEILHEDVETLAIENETSTTAIRYAIKKEGWERKPLAVAVQNWENLNPEEMDEELLDSVQDRIRLLNLMKQAALNPRYIALEAAILSKAIETIQALPPNMATNSAQLKNITEVLSALRQQNSVLSATVTAGGVEEGGLRVNIINQVPPVEKPPAQVVDIKKGLETKQITQ